MDRPTAPDAEALAEAARNLLVSCAEFARGDRLEICREDARHGWYDAAVVEAVAREAERLGLSVSLCEVLPPDMAQPQVAMDTLATAGNIVFFARIGDQDRFGAGGARGRRVMVYARNAADLASDFGRVPHPAMRHFKAAVDRLLFAATEIAITCPNGTALSGRVHATGAGVADTTVRRFPLGVPAPVPAGGFSGRVALTDSLTPTGNSCYDPPVLHLAAPVMAEIRDGRITGFDGDPAQVARIEAHYARVSLRLGLDPWVVHSWHAGLHPGCRFFAQDGSDRDYWSNTVFSNPRVLHFHTCGAMAPGEISWNLIDATVTVDGTPLWQAGMLRPRAFPALAAVVEADQALARLFPG